MKVTLQEVYEILYWNLLQKLNSDSSRPLLIVLIAKKILKFFNMWKMVNTAHGFILHDVYYWKEYVVLWNFKHQDYKLVYM